MSNQAEITKFHVNAKVQMRYAITNIETKVKNSNNETSNVHFNMYIPKEAFVSNFSMVIKDKTYVAKVDTKENALQIFENSTTTSGIVQSFNDPKFKDGKHVSKYFFSMRKLEGMQIRKVFATNTKIISIKHISRCQQLLSKNSAVIYFFWPEKSYTILQSVMNTSKQNSDRKPDNFSYPYYLYTFIQKPF